MRAYSRFLQQARARGVPRLASACLLRVCSQPMPSTPASPTPTSPTPASPSLPPTALPPQIKNDPHGAARYISSADRIEQRQNEARSELMFSREWASAAAFVGGLGGTPRGGAAM